MSGASGEISRKGPKGKRKAESEDIAILRQNLINFAKSATIDYNAPVVLAAMISHSVTNSKTIKLMARPVG